MPEGTYGPPIDGIVSQSWTGNPPLTRAKLHVKTGETVGVKKEGAKALYDLGDAIFSQSGCYRRGAMSGELSNAVFDSVMKL